MFWTRNSTDFSCRKMEYTVGDSRGGPVVVGGKRRAVENAMFIATSSFSTTIQQAALCARSQRLFHKKFMQIILRGKVFKIHVDFLICTFHIVFDDYYFSFLQPSPLLQLTLRLGGQTLPATSLACDQLWTALVGSDG